MEKACGEAITRGMEKRFGVRLHDSRFRRPHGNSNQQKNRKRVKIF